MTARPEGPIEPVVIARDGEVGVEVLDADGPHKVPNRTADAIYFTLRRAPNGDTARVGVLFSDLFELTNPRTLGLTGEITRGKFQMECALASIGEYLDSRGLPPATKSGESATSIECFSYQFGDWEERKPADDAQVFEYVKAKAYWAWRFDIGLAQLSSGDCLRLHVPLKTLARVAQLGDDELWEATMGSGLLLKPAGRLAREFHARKHLLSGKVGDSIEAQLLAPRYAGPREQWAKAQNFAHGEARDLANAAKEAVGAVEGMARIVTGRYNDTLGDLIKHLKAQYQIDPALAKSLEGVWGFASSSPGVRHGGVEPATIDDGQAHYVLDSSVAALRFLLRLDSNSGSRPV